MFDIHKVIFLTITVKTKNPKKKGRKEARKWTFLGTPNLLITHM